MDPNHYQIESGRTECDQHEAVMRLVNDWKRLMPVLHAVVGMAGEVGEMAAHLERVIWYGTKQLDTVNLGEENGDVDWYQAQMYRALGLQAGAVMAANLDKLMQRYPIKFDRHRSKEENRDRRAEREILVDRNQKGQFIRKEQSERDPLEERCRLCGFSGYAKDSFLVEETGLCKECSDRTLNNLVDFLSRPKPVMEQTGHGFAEPSEEECRDVPKEPSWEHIAKAAADLLHGADYRRIKELIDAKGK